MHFNAYRLIRAIHFKMTHANLVRIINLSSVYMHWRRPLQ